MLRDAYKLLLQDETTCSWFHWPAGAGGEFLQSEVAAETILRVCCALERMDGVGDTRTGQSQEN